MTDDEWARLQKTDFPGVDAVRDLLGEPRPEHPGWIALAFFSALHDLDQDSLSWLVTPESLPDWGDFSGARELFDSVPGAGLGSTANRAYDAPDVAYVKVLSNVGEGFLVSEEQVLSASAIVSLVWRPESNAWKVHAFSTDYVRPEDMPRTSPGVAPDERSIG